MESILVGMAERSPIAVALIIVVIVYVRAQNHGLKTFLSVLEKRDALLTTISDQCHNTQKETSKQTSNAIIDNTRVLGKVERALDKVNGYAQGR